MQNNVAGMITEYGKDHKIVIVAGPTASGKSQLAIDIAAHFGGEIVNADSMQIYRDLHILTARPEPDDEARVPHHLYGVRAASERCSVGEWLNMAEDVIRGIQARGALPIICGGTGLYIKVLMEGIAEVPPVPEAISLEVRSILEMEGLEAVYHRLAELDCDAARRLHPTDMQRIVRAYEVVRASGRPLSEWQSEQSGEPPFDAHFTIVCLMPDRDALYRKIETRFDDMMIAGALEEVAGLVAADIAPEMPAMKALGVPDFRDHLAGKCELNAAVEKAKQATRNYAKRQMTWFRNQMTPDFVYRGFGAAAFEELAPSLETRLNGGE